MTADMTADMAAERAEAEGTPPAVPLRAVRTTSLADLLTLQPLERDLFRSTVVVEQEGALYGGQVAAQALLAAGLTVSDGREPHSLHGYFLRRGDAAHPVLFRVDRDRDGRSFSARRVVAVQHGKVIFTMAASFHVREEGPDQQIDPVPVTELPDDLPDTEQLPVTVSVEARRTTQPYPGMEWPTRFWVRCTDDEIPDDPLHHASVLTYVSDSSSGLSPLHSDEGATGSTIDHAVWFHRPVRMDQWVLMDLTPRTIAAGRGLYSGTVHSQDGALVASLTQEALFRRHLPVAWQTGVRHR